MKLKVILKEERIKKGLLVKELASLTKIDQALISKFESGTRTPTKEQIMSIADVLTINVNEILVIWMKEKVLYQIGDDSLAHQALIMAEAEIAYNANQKPKISLPKKIKDQLKEIDKLKEELNSYRKFDSYRVAQALEIEYTYESNRIEGNTLTLKETDLVINEGLTVSGKSMREHLEAINHQDAIEYLKSLIKKDSDINEREILTIHNLILRGIDKANAGKYRDVQVMIKGSKHMPPAPYLVKKQMEDFLIWYEGNKYLLHPIVLAAEVHERVVTIHPFIDGNGRTSRLLMNMVLLKHGFVIANIKGDLASRMSYYSSLEKAQVNGNKFDFINLVLDEEMRALERYISILSK